VLVRNEGRQFVDCASEIEEAALKDIQREERHYVISGVQHVKVVLQYSRAHCLQGSEGSLLEGKDVSSVRGASLREYHNRWIFSLSLYNLLSLLNLIYCVISDVLGCASGDKYAAECSTKKTENRNVSELLL
jgi:hypothetical protein